MGHFYLSDHRVQNLLTWANDALGHVKESHQIWILFVQYVLVHHLLSSWDFEPRDRSAANFPLARKTENSTIWLISSGVCVLAEHKNCLQMSKIVQEVRWISIGALILRRFTHDYLSCFTCVNKIHENKLGNWTALNFYVECKPLI